MSDEMPGADPGITKSALQAFAFLSVLLFVLFALSILYTAHAVNAVRLQARAECQFDSDLGAAPVTLNPATHKPSLLGVTIVSDARVAWHGLGCAGRLPAADPSFIRWAKYYRLPYR